MSASASTGSTAPVRVDRGGHRLGPQPPVPVDRERPDPARADPEQLGGPDHGVVHLGRAVEREPCPGKAVVAGPRQGTFACGREGGEVRDRPSARERPGLPGEAHQLAGPADGLHLDLGSGAGPDREVDVVAGGESVGDHPDLQARGADEREVARARLRDALVERPGGVEHPLLSAHPPRRQPLLQDFRERGVERRLADAEAVEAAPGLLDQRHRAGKRLVAADVEA
jgi:hypothetical protein